MTKFGFQHHPRDTLSVFMSFVTEPQVNPGVGLYDVLRDLVMALSGTAFDP